MTHPIKILIVNPFGIGDVLFTTVIARNIKAHWPGCEIGYVCNRRVEPLIQAHELVDWYVCYERDEFYKVYKENKFKFLKKWWCFFKAIQRQNFDIVFDCSMNRSFNFIMWLAGIPKRYGLNFRNRVWCLSQSLELGRDGFKDRHVITYYQDLLSLAGIPSSLDEMSLSCLDSDRLWVDKVLQDNGLGQSKPLFAIVPGGGSSWGKDAHLKRWPAVHFAKLADKLIENYQAQIILMGDQSELDLCQSVSKAMTHKALNLCGQTSITQLAAIFKKCRLVIANDGGPMHIAVASGAKTVAIFGPVDHRVYGPYPRNGHVVISPDQAPAYQGFRLDRQKAEQSLQSIQPQDVLRKVSDVL